MVLSLRFLAHTASLPPVQGAEFMALLRSSNCSASGTSLRAGSSLGFSLRVLAQVLCINPCHHSSTSALVMVKRVLTDAHWRVRAAPSGEVYAIGDAPTVRSVLSSLSQICALTMIA